MHKFNDGEVEMINKYSRSLIIFKQGQFALVATKKWFAKKIKRTTVKVS